MTKIILVGLLFLTACSKSVTKDPNAQPPLTIPNETVLNGPLVAGGDVSEIFKATPNGGNVVYIADETVNGDNYLYVVDNQANNRRTLVAVPAGRDVIHFIISPDSTRVAFLADLTTAGRYDLYTIKLDGTDLTKMNSGITNNAHTVSKSYKFTSDSSKVVFVTDEITGVRNLFISNATSPVNRIQLNTAGKAPVSSAFELAPNNSRVVYKESSDPSHPNIRSVTLAGSGDIQLNTTFVLPASGASDFIVSPNSLKVVYRANQDDDAIYELYAVNTDGTGGVQKINGSIVTGGSVMALGFKFNSSSSKVVYIADQNTDEKQELYVSNIDGTSNLKLNGTLPANGDVSNFKISPSGSLVVYRADVNTDDANDLYSVQINGSSNTKINSSLSAGENVGEYLILNDSTNRIVYAMDKTQAGKYSIYISNSNGTGELKLNENIGTGVGFFDPVQSSITQSKQIGFLFDGSRIVMVGSMTGTNLDIFSVALDGSKFKKLNQGTSGSIVLNSTVDGSSFLTLENYPLVVYRYNDGSKTQLYVALAKD